MARVGFIGTKSFGLRIFEEMIAAVPPDHRVVGAITLDDKEDTRSVLPRFRTTSSDGGCPLTMVSRPDEVHETVQSWDADTVIVCGWYQIVDVARFPQTLFYGFHASPLPRYRGGAPLVWQILRGESAVGLSFFQFDRGIDSGPIVAQEMLPLAHDESIGEVLLRVEAAGVAQLRKYLLPLLEGTAEFVPQDESRATYCGQRIPGDGLIDWSLDAVRLHNFVRAQSKPYPGAFTHLPTGERVSIWKAVPEERIFFGVPGAVVARTSDEVVVACGEGALRILEVELEGSTLGSPSDIFSGLTLRLR